MAMIDEGTRRRLQAQFQQGAKMSATGNFDYATEMFSACVLGDPGNLLYVSNFLGNLQKKYNNNKKGAKLASMRVAGPKAAIKKSVMQKHWPEIVKSGLEVLKLNPWDTGTLKDLALACENLHYDECQLAYLRAALDADMADPEINRVAGRALAKQGKFDDAIRCFTRVVKALPKDEEANRAIADLTVEKTISKGGYEEAESTRDVRANKEDEAPKGLQITPERQLEKEIAKNPADAGLYLKLADLHVTKERFEEAEKVLAKALEASGGDVNVRERLEDVQLRRQREQLVTAERLAREKKTPEAVALYKEMHSALNRLEMDVFRSRVERNPQHYGYKIELATRLKTAGMYKEAIPLFQAAQSDAGRRGEVLLHLGDCFVQIKQYPLAMRSYEAAVEATAGDLDVERRKKALYMAGKIAMLALKDLAKADNYLNEVAGLDFAYKDVADLLDKIRKMREDG
ncbi:MAG: tetratricopeptide repeat protein [Pirellulales bacterium]|nr:tetratricopeptide repeat protein [Pirellulales bacterium]